VLGARVPACLLALGLFAAAAAGARTPPPAANPWHDTPATRLAALALVESLNAELLASQSATLTLEHWCATHGLAEPARLQAKPLASTPDDVAADVRRDLEVGEHDLVIHRRVELRCGQKLLSVADNWYVPARLSSAMNQQLEHSQVPLGKVAQPLRPTRRTLSAKLLWSPLGEGWELAPRAAAPAGSAVGAPLEIPQALFEHRALLSGSDHRPIAEVRETYQRALLDFPEPAIR